jgi:Flp pilus assembly protein TadG
MVQHMPSAARGFARNAQGVSAVEFALILPFMLLLYLGGVEVTRAITVDRKVTAATSAIGDLVAQSPEISNSDLNSIYNAARAILAPYDSDALEIVVSSVRVDADGAVVEWSSSKNGTCRAAGSAIALPANIAIDGQYVIVAEASYPYQSGIGKIITDGFTLSETFYLRPRQSEAVEPVGNLNC